jgi:hypothetical protein
MGGVTEPEHQLCSMPLRKNLTITDFKPIEFEGFWHTSIFFKVLTRKDHNPR